MNPQFLLDSLQVAVVVIDGDNCVHYLNQAAEFLLGISHRQIHQHSLFGLLSGLQTLEMGMNHCRHTHQHHTERRFSLALPQGQTITVDCTFSPLVDPSLPNWLAIELNQVDQQLRQSREEHLQSQQQISRVLMRNLAHEIKNPLGGLRGAAQLLERELHSDELREYTRIIIGEADRLRTLVDRMLGPTRPPVWVAVNIHELLERVASLVLAAHENLTISRDYDPSVPPLMGDADQLIQAIFNIVGNAAEALQGCGTIQLRTRVLRQHTLGVRRHRLVLKLDILDDGPGIPPHLGETIFYPMISGRAEGSGLGLSIAQMLVQLHGGLIECQSRPGDTVFTLLLPLEGRDGK